MIGLLISIAVLTLAPVHSGDIGWEHEKTRDGVVVYTRTPTGSSIKEYKAIAQFEATVQDIEHLIDDVQSHPQWQNKVCKASKVRLENGAKDHIFVELEVPWPFKNRYVLVDSEKIHTEDGKTVYDLVIVGTIANRARTSSKSRQAGAVGKSRRRRTGKSRSSASFTLIPEELCQPGSSTCSLSMVRSRP